MKRNYITNRPQPSSEEISRLQDFSKIMKGAEMSSLSLVWISSVVVTLALFFTLSNWSPDTGSGSDNSAQNNAAIPSSEQTLASKTIQVPTHSIKIDNSKDTAFLLPSGTAVAIASNTFQGDYTEFSITEYNTITDIWASNISMEYDSLGARVFESDGMFRIVAKNDNGAPTHPQHPILIDIPLTSTDSNFGFYKLDESSSQWSLTPSKVQKLDSAPNQAQELTHLEQKIEELKFTLPPIPEAASTFKGATFDFEFDLIEFSELASLNDVKFGFIDQRDNKQELYTTEWENAQLTKVKNGIYRIILQKGRTSTSFLVRPLLSETDFNSRMLDYEDQNQKTLHEIEKLKFSLEKAKALHASKMTEFKREAEKATVAQESYDEKLSKQYKALRLLRNNFKRPTRTAEVLSLGIFNFDCARPKKPKGKKGVARFIDKARGKVIVPMLVFLVEKGRRLIYSFDKEDLQGDFSVNLTNENILWFVTSDGRIAKAELNNTYSLYNKDLHVYEIHVNTSSEPLTTREEIDAFLGLNEIEPSARPMM